MTSVRNCSSAFARMSPRHINAVSSSSTSRPIETTRSVPCADGALVGDDLPLAVGLRRPGQPARHAEHARDREAPDVGVEHADGEPAGRERSREVGGDRRLPDATLAAADRDHACRRRHLGRRRRLRGAQPRLLHERRSVRPGSSRRTRPVPRRRPGSPATFERTSLPICPRNGQAAVVERDLDHDVAGRCHLDVMDHAEIDDRGPELGVEHAREGTQDIVG